MARSRSYKTLLLKSLRDPRDWRAYLQAVLEDLQENDELSLQQLTVAIKDVLKAQSLKDKQASSK